MNCKKCGSPLNADDQFCQNCGESVNSQQNNDPVIISNSQSMGIDPAMNNNQSSMDMGPTMSNNQPSMDMEPTMSNNQPSMGMGPTMNNDQSSMGMGPVMIDSQSSMGMESTINNNQPTMNNNQQPQNKLDKKKLYMIIGIVAAVVIVIIVIISITGNKNEIVPNQGDAQPVSQTNRSVYKVSYGGFIFEIPDHLLYQIQNGLMIGDSEGTWVTLLAVVKNTSFTGAKANKSKLASTLKQNGLTTKEAELQTLGGVEYITVEATASGQNTLIAYAELNSTAVVGVMANNENNEFDYTLLEQLAPIISSATLNEETIYSIKSDSKIDLNKIASIAK